MIPMPLPPPMTLTQLVILAPLLVLAASPVVLMLVLAFVRDHRLTLALTLVGLALTVVAAWVVRSGAPTQVTSLLLIDRFALFYIGLFALTAFAVALLAFGYLRRQDELPDEFYLLLQMATLGCAVLAAATHFASFFLGLEILSVSLYAMIAYLRQRERAVEAGLKYLILAGTSSAFLLFGMALVYAGVGSMQFAEVARALAGAARGAWVMSGVGMIVIGIGFKLAVVPFHMWTPDVYEGAPAPVTAFIATASKGGVFALLLRLFGQLDVQRYPSLLFLFAMIAIASMLTGNLLALMQSNLKRILAYSSIAHLGYMLVAFLAGRTLAVEAATIYLVAYFVTTLIAFGVIAFLTGAHTHDRDDLTEYRGLFWRRPGVAIVLAAALMSLAGIPLTAGFIGKFYVLVAGAHGALWALMIVLVVSSAIGLYYYLRVVVAMVDRSAERPAEAPAPRAAWSVSGGLTLAALLVILIWLGVYPAPLIGLIRAAAAGFTF